MTPDERAALVARLRASHRQLRHTRLDDTADLIEADGKLIALADAAPHTFACNQSMKHDGADSSRYGCTCWKADYDAEKGKAL